MKKIKLILFFLSIAKLSQAQNVDLKQWQVYSENNEPLPMVEVGFAGKKSIHLDSKHSAIIWNEEMNYKNFQIDLDIAGAVMSGIGFHAKDEQNYQFLYFRPGYGGTDEAIQYIPIFNGALSWVFYNPPLYEKTADITAQKWFHATLEVKNNRLKVYVNDSKEAQMDIALLETDRDRGSILLRTLFGDSYFANITITELPETLIDWQISEQFPSENPLSYKDFKVVKNWTSIKPTAGEYVNLAKYIVKPTGQAFAKTTIHSEKEKQGLLFFDFAGKLTIYLNGVVVFKYDKYMLDRLSSDNHSIVIKLNKGENEILFLTEGDGFVFGKGFNSMGRSQHQNWGFVAHLAEKTP